MVKEWRERVSIWVRGSGEPQRFPVSSMAAAKRYSHGSYISMKSQRYGCLSNCYIMTSVDMSIWMEKKCLLGPTHRWGDIEKQWILRERESGFSRNNPSGYYPIILVIIQIVQSQLVSSKHMNMNVWATLNELSRLYKYQ